MLLTTYHETFIISTDNNKKGKIKINLEKNVQGGSLSSLIYSFYKLIGGKVFDIMSVYACDKFENEYYKIHNEKHKKDTTIKRPFLFSDNCVSKEIKEHVLGYWYSTDVSGIKKMICLLLLEHTQVLIIKTN